MRKKDLFGNISVKNKTVESIAYMGSKRKLATKILNAIYNTIGDFKHFYDMFGGARTAGIYFRV